MIYGDIIEYNTKIFYNKMRQDSIKIFVHSADENAAAPLFYKKQSGRSLDVDLWNASQSAPAFSAQARYPAVRWRMMGVIFAVRS